MIKKREFYRRQKRNPLINTHYKLFLVVLILFFTISLVCAAEFDNTLNYKDNDMTAVIKNWFGLTTIGEATLSSHKNVDEIRVVGIGDNVPVMSYNFKGFNSVYENGLGNVKFIDMNTGKEVQRDYYFAKAIYNKGGKIVSYERLTENDIPNIETEIWLMAEVRVFDKVDGIWTIAGKEISKHAVWTSSFDVDNVAYWKLDGTSGIVDDEVNNANGTNVGALRGRPGVLENSFILDGDNDWINMSSKSVSFNTTNFSVSMWVRLNSTSADQTSDQNIMTNRPSLEPDSATPYTLSIINGELNFKVLNRNRVEANAKIGSGNLTVGTWYHLVLRYNGSAVDLYLDGVRNVTTVTNFDPTNYSLINMSNPGLAFGRERTSQAKYFNGSIDEIGWWNRSLTASEISDLYNAGVGLAYQGGVESITTSLIAPADASDMIIGAYTLFNASLAPTGGANLTNGTLYIWNSTNDVLNLTTNTITGNSTNSTTWNVSISQLGDGMIWNTFGCITNSTGEAICDWGDNNRTFDIKAFTEDDVSFSKVVFETNDEYFQQNITVSSGITVISTNLIYNGTTYPGTATELTDTTYSLSRTIDIPVIDNNSSNNKTFFFDFTYLLSGDRINRNTTQYNHQVNLTLLRDCVGDAPVAVNFSIFDETNRSLEVNTTDFFGSWDYYLGTGTVVKNNFTSKDGVRSVSLCNNLDSETYIVSSRIDLEALTYTDRSYDFRLEEYNKSTTNQSLYLLNDSVDKPVIIEVKDQGLISLSEYLVEVLRFYPGIGDYVLVESRLTDDFGTFVAKLVENDVRYQFRFYDEDKVLQKTTGDVSIACKSTICTIPFVVEESGDDFTEFEDLTDYTSSLIFDNSTNTFTFTWDDNRGESSIHRLHVVRRLLNSTDVICNVSSTVQAFSLDCAIGDIKGNYIAQGFRKVGTDERRIVVLSTRLGETASIYGVEGLMWTFILLFTLIAVGSFNPPAGVGLYLGGFIAFGVLGIISFNPAIFFANLAIGVIFIWAFRS